MASTLDHRLGHLAFLGVRSGIPQEFGQGSHLLASLFEIPTRLRLRLGFAERLRQELLEFLLVEKFLGGRVLSGHGGQLLQERAQLAIHLLELRHLLQFVQHRQGARVVTGLDQLLRPVTDFVQLLLLARKQLAQSLDLGLAVEIGPHVRDAAWQGLQQVHGAAVILAGGALHRRLQEPAHDHGVEPLAQVPDRAILFHVLVSGDRDRLEVSQLESRSRVVPLLGFLPGGVQ